MIPPVIKTETIIIGWKATAYYRMSFNKIKFEKFYRSDGTFVISREMFNFHGVLL